MLRTCPGQARISESDIFTVGETGRTKSITKYLVYLLLIHHYRHRNHLQNMSVSSEVTFKE